MSKLVVNQLSKRFGQKEAVNSLSFSVEKEKAYCLLGGNGAGKSTTINMLLGFLKPDQGQSHFGELDLWKNREAAKKHLFYLPDQVNFYPELSAIENVIYLAGLSGDKLGLDVVQKNLSDVGLESDAHNKRIGEFSKGMRQKVALALAKIKKSDLLILDEPTTGLDPIAIREFVSLINELKREGACIVMVSHDLQCAHLLADEIGILQSGVLKEEITNDHLSLDELETRYFNSVK